MSKQNKVNKTNYDQGGRLTPDDIARERKKQTEVSAHGKGKERIMAKAPASAKTTARPAFPKAAARPASSTATARPASATATAKQAEPERGGERGASRPRNAREE
jgi:hypothetical protein